MEQIARSCFPAAKRVTDRFHVQKLAYEAVQEMRVKEMCIRDSCEVKESCCLAFRE